MEVVFFLLTSFFQNAFSIEFLLDNLFSLRILASLFHGPLTFMFAIEKAIVSLLFKINNCCYSTVTFSKSYPFVIHGFIGFVTL